MNGTETKIYTALLIAALILTVILVFFIFTVLRNQKLNALLYEQQIQAEVNTLESERKRIAEDLHDDIGPLLSSVKMQVDCLNTSDEEDLETMERVGRYMDEIMQKLRETSNNLLPRVLAKNGLQVAIKDFAADLNKAKAMKVCAKVPAEKVALPAEKEVHLYRIIQEVVNNSIKHAQATELSIELEVKNQKLALQLIDNGKGFDHQKLMKESMGLGLKNIITRTNILDGEVFLESKPGKGVHYTIEIPLEA
jgi:signal transduction histidine kinase